MNKLHFSEGQAGARDSAICDVGAATNEIHTGSRGYRAHAPQAGKAGPISHSAGYDFGVRNTEIYIRNIYIHVKKV
jgi:hypothetical protein